MLPTRNNRGIGARERLDRKPARSSEAGARGRAAASADRVASIRWRPIAASSTRSSGGATRATASGSLSSARPCNRCRRAEQRITRRPLSPSLRPAGSFSEKCFYSMPSRLIAIGFACGSTTTGSNASSASTAADDAAPGPASPQWQARHVIDYRHIIHSLRASQWPASTWSIVSSSSRAAPIKRAFEALLAGDSEKQACRHHGRAVGARS